MAVQDEKRVHSVQLLRRTTETFTESLTIYTLKVDSSIQDYTGAFVMPGKLPDSSGSPVSRNVQDGLRKAAYGRLVDGYGNDFKTPGYTII